MNISTIRFFTQSPKDREPFFGASAVDVASSSGWGCAAARQIPQNKCISGTYDELLAELTQLSGSGFVPDAMIVFTKEPLNAAAFLRACGELYPNVPVAGGGASPIGETPAILCPDGADAAVCLFCDKRYRWRHVWKNVFTPLDKKCVILPAGKRVIRAVRYNGKEYPAQEWHAMLSENFGLDASRYERLTITASDGVNIHLSPGIGDTLGCGSDLPDQTEFTVSLFEDITAFAEIERFCNMQDAFVFGCAGLRSLVKKPFTIGTNAIAGFFHGEIMTCGIPRFGNLMLSALLAENKE